ncbi:nitroreductase/quinone reductase family protein [Hamadaea sp. NPDC050747]|uniref:nitroreductase/quinone reductase family protein n=1 Tax=Hamadaea sp. NPDC050747 TaxID=3155789 RepID=UPI0033EE919F
MYPHDRPNRLARALNSLSVVQFRSGVLASRRWVVMEVRGYRSGRVISCPLVVASVAGHRYLVSMLGEKANWVRNVRAADGHVVLRQRGREPVRLVEVPVADRARIIRRYLDFAPGARPHIPVDRHAPVEEFEKIADRIPVFRVTAEA